MSELTIIQDNLKTQLVSAKNILPSHINFDRFVTAAAVAIANNPDLDVADPQSLINSLTLCAKDGLIPDNREAALVVFNTKVKRNGLDTWIKKVQYMPMVDGVMKRARQTGEISIIAARIVYENDAFRAWMDDSGEHISYEPTLGERGNIIGAFAYARMHKGEVQFEWMNPADIEKVRLASKNPDSPPWKNWWEGMARKSVMHRLARRLPNSSELMEMLERGNEMNWQQDVIEKDVTPNRSSGDIDNLNNLINETTSLKGNDISSAIDNNSPVVSDSVKTNPDTPDIITESDRNAFDALLWQMGECQSMGELRGVAKQMRLLPKDPISTEEANRKYQQARERIESSTSS
ncbi:hypothetical protein BV923_09635 [Pectobacterium odoriferum]|uniref:recombinase RecT n=1 Tax=Pectobacterium odoriferum TaxID=78398 RepID=UPI000CD19D15|nr:recombinase RecT [Pectobacterium odoriferum]POE22837.1 hypothetical protein BV923_09635 [Pectobacterium odoriferum]